MKDRKNDVEMKGVELPFDPKVFLDTENVGRTIAKYRKGEAVFSQGDAADAVFYIQLGKVKMSVVSELEEARSAVAVYLNVFPNGSMRDVDRYPLKSAAHKESLFLGLRKAGLPE